MNNNSLAHLVQRARQLTITPVAVYSQVSMHRLPAPASTVLPAEVVARVGDECHVRIAGTHDLFLPACALAADVTEFTVRMQPNGLTILPAA